MAMKVRSTAVIIQNRDGTLVREPDPRRLLPDKQKSYYAQLPEDLLDEHSNLIDRLISFAFDTLGVFRLEVRVRNAE